VRAGERVWRTWEIAASERVLQKEGITKLEAGVERILARHDLDLEA